MWLKMTHPHHPPIVYVTPTVGMAIQPSQYVDTNGIVYLPYLTEWKSVSFRERDTSLIRTPFLSQRIGYFMQFTRTPLIWTLSSIQWCPD